MKALTVEEKGQGVVYKEVADAVPTGDEVIVSLQAAAMNHRDVWITQGLYPKIQYPAILGSDVAGYWDNQPVVINPSLNWGSNLRFPAPDYQILGMPKAGTFAQQIAIDKRQLIAKPAHLSMEEAAAIPLGGLTAYRAIFTKGQVKKNDHVLISGIGGGVALFAFQFTLAVGAKVYVTSGSDQKIEKAKAMGAAGGVNYQNADWVKELGKKSGGFDLIIDSAGGDGFAQLLKLCRFGARVVTYGGGQGYVNKLSPQLIFWRQVSILGTSMGNDVEFDAMVNFISAHKIVPVVDSVRPLAEGADGFDRMDQGKQFGKIVFSIAQ